MISLSKSVFAFAFLTVVAAAGLSSTSTTAADDNDRLLKGRGGRGGGSRPSGGSSTLFGSGGGGGGGSGGGSAVPKAGNYLNGGLGDKYSSSSSSSTTSETPSRGTAGNAQGSCCNYQCCRAGYVAGYTRFWYYGYRPLSEEGDNFQSELREARVAVRDLVQLNETEELFTGDCALVPDVDENGFLLLLNQTEASPEALANSTNVTLRTELQDLSDRLDYYFDGNLEEEIDIREKLREWFLDYYALQPCLELLSEQSSESESRVLSTRQEVEDAEVVVNSWEAKLQSSGRVVWGMAGVMGLATLCLSVLLL